MTLWEECYIVTPRDGELPFHQITAHLMSMPEVRAVTTRPPGAYLLDQDAERADIVLGMTHDDAPNLPPTAIYIFLMSSPSRVVLDLEGGSEGAREVLVRFLEWLAERCPFAVHDNQGRYAHEIDEKGLSAFLFESCE